MKHYLNSPCGHGKLVDVVPYAGLSEKEWEGASQRRWGLQYLVLRGDAPADREEPRKPVPCCSFSEGEFDTEAEALDAAAHAKRHTAKNLDSALALLAGVEREAWSAARVTILDLAQLAYVLRHEGPRCSEPLCFELGISAWLVDEERDVVLCHEHLTGKTIFDHRGQEVVA